MHTMFLNRGVVIHYHEDLYNQTISGFLLINKACSLSDVLIGDGQRGRSGTTTGCLPVSGAPRGLKGADERSHAHTRRNVSDGGGVKTAGTVIDAAAKRESGGGRDGGGGRERGGIVWEERRLNVSGPAPGALPRFPGNTSIYNLYGASRGNRGGSLPSEDGGRRSVALTAWIACKCSPAPDKSTPSITAYFFFF